MNRREFLRAAGAGVVLSAVGNTVPAFAQPKPKRVGLIGPGWYGKSALFRLLQIEPVEVVALCDVDKRMVAEAAEMVARGRKEAGEARELVLQAAEEASLPRTRQAPPASLRKEEHHYPDTAEAH